MNKEIRNSGAASTSTSSLIGDKVELEAAFLGIGSRLYDASIGGLCLLPVPQALDLALKACAGSA